MMPVVRISDQTWARLQQYAQPLVDTPDSVINAALDALDQTQRPKKITPPQSSAGKERKGGELTPQKEFRKPLVDTLSKLGGSAPTSKIRSEMEKLLAPVLKEADYEFVSSGDPRWWNATCWERNNLVKEGLFRKDSPRGTWELSESGKTAVRKSTVR